MKKGLLIFLALASLTAAGVVTKTVYKEAPDQSYVDDVHYDKDLKVIVVHVHAKAWFINVDQIYGIRVQDDTDLEKTILRVMGEKPAIVRLEATQSKGM